MRYWAALARPGVDTAFDEMQMKNGKRLATKLRNAARFARQFETDGLSTPDVSVALDLSFRAYLGEVISDATAKLNGYDYAGALDGIERTFWSFCDFYIELAKGRAYDGTGAARDSARCSLIDAIDTFVRAFAPYIPFVTDEVWLQRHTTSVHRQAWPKLDTDGGDPALYVFAVEALRAIRSAKSAADVSVGTPVDVLALEVPHDATSAIATIIDDIRLAARAGHIDVLGDRPEWKASVPESNNGHQPAPAHEISGGHG